ILFAKAEQLSLLFDTPVRVEGSVRKDGTVVKPHVRIQKKKAPASSAKPTQPQVKPVPVKKPSKIEAFIAKQGGIHHLASKLSTLTEGQQQTIFANMARMEGKTVAEVSALFDGLLASEQSAQKVNP